MQWASELRRERCSVSELYIAVKCGESDTTSGLGSNPTVGNFIDKVDPLGATTCFGETTDAAGRFLLTAYYGGGGVTVHRIEEDGAIGEQIQYIETGEKAHAILRTDEDFVFVPHVCPNNRTAQFRFDPDTGQLAANDTLRNNFAGTYIRGLIAYAEGMHALQHDDIAAAGTHRDTLSDINWSFAFGFSGGNDHYYARRRVRYLEVLADELQAHIHSGRGEHDLARAVPAQDGVLADRAVPAAVTAYSAPMVVGESV